MSRKIGFGNKIALSMVIVGLIPVVLSLMLTYYKGTEELRKTIGADFAELARQAAYRVDMQLKMEFNEIKMLVNSMKLEQFLEAGNRQYKGLSQKEIAALLKRNEKEWKEYPDFRVGILNNEISKQLRNFMYMEQKKDVQFGFFITDTQGSIQAAINGSLPYLHAKEDWWEAAYHNGRGKLIISNLYFDKKINSFVFHIITPIYSKNNKLQGMLWTGYMKDFLGSAINDIQFGRTGHAMLIDAQGSVLFCPLLPTGSHVADNALVKAITSGDSGWVLALDDAHGGINSIVGFAPVAVLNNLLEANINSKTKINKWYSVIRQDPRESNKPISSLFLYNSISGLILVVIISLIGLFISRKLVKPLEKLRIGVRNIGHGDLDHRIFINTGDEFEDLSLEFNQMAQKLKKSYAFMLEQKVHARTRELYILNTIATTVNQSLDLQAILDSALDKVIEVTKVDSGAIRVFDKETGILRLQSCHGISADIIKLHEEIQLGEQLAGKVAKYHKPITLNRDFDKSSQMIERQSLYSDSFRAITCVPLLSKKELVGTLSIATFKTGYLKEQDMELLLGIANLIGTAIGNATAFEKSEQLAAMEEREWMSRELHDGVAQDLAYLKMQMSLLGKNVYKHSKETIESDLKKLSNLIIHTYDSVRDLLGAFRPGLKDENEFVDTIEEYFHRVQEESNLKVISTISVDLNSLTSLTLVHLFRIIQEGISNTRKHADASTVIVSLKKMDEYIILEIKDNGKGFDEIKKKSSVGSNLGLTIMQERAEKTGGSFSLESQPGSGTAITIKIPFEGEGKNGKKSESRSSR